MARQLTFDLPSEPALGRGDFFISPSNGNAVELIQGWHDWPQGKLVLVGPSGAGKTHLAHVWAALSNAQIVAAVDPGDVDALATTALAVEDCDQVAGDTMREEALFHLHNLALSRGHPVLFTAACPPARWNLSLPDLASRMQGSAMITLSAPDDALLSAVMVKQFADRQLAVAPDVIAYLTARMARSFADAGALVAALDAAALAQKRPVTKVLAGEVLDKMQRDRA